MSFLNGPTERVIPSPQEQARRLKLAEALLETFARAFPEIIYEFVWESTSLNAQAWMLGSERCVRLYGGLVRHSAMSKCGLALVLAHETGHHLGGPPYDPAFRWMTWQGQADYWAARTGMPLVFGARARKMTLQGASEIFDLHKELSAQLDDDEPDLSPNCRYRIFRSGAHGFEMPKCALKTSPQFQRGQRNE